MRLFIFLCIAILSFTSCTKGLLDEDPKGNLVQENFYRTDADLELASVALYNRLNGNFISGPNYGPLFGADDIMTVRNGNKITYADFDTFQANSSNDKLNWWRNFYSLIKAANGILNNYEQADQATEEKKRSTAGEAHFMRGFAYFFLTRTWGEIPLVLEDEVNYEIRKSSPAEVYEQILADLLMAEELLPDSWSGIRQQNGVDIAPTKGSVKALLANVYLTMAGWPLKQTDKYQLAAAKAREVIDGRSLWGYDLLPDFGDLWKKENSYNRETVFGCYYNISTATPVTNNSNGLVIAFMPEDEGGYGVGYGEIAFYNRFPDGPRKRATYQYEYFINNDPKNVVTYEKTLRYHPCFIKQRDADNYNWSTHTLTGASTSRTIPVIRFAEVLLTYAEAQAMSAGPDASAYDAVNQVRRRAGLSDLTPGLSREAFRDTVVMERGWEFAGVEPAARWFDLIRTETVGKSTQYRDAKEDPLKNIPSDTEHTFYWAPIPINDAELNPNL